MLTELQNFDWKEVFGYAGEEDAHEVSKPTAALGSSASTETFTREDVTYIIGLREGKNDEENWLCAGQLKDGRWFLVEAGCDYTGWG